MPLATATIPLSGSVSGNIDLRDLRRGIVAISVPVITSGDLFIQGGFDTTSANFTRLLQPPMDGPTSGYLRFAVGAGSCAIPWPANLRVPEFIRLETSVPQAVARAFSVLFN